MLTNLNLSQSGFPHMYKVSYTALGRNIDFSKGTSKVKKAEKHFLTTDFTYQAGVPEKKKRSLAPEII